MKIAFCCQWDFMPQKAAFKNQSFYTPMNDFHGICQKKWDIRWTRTLKLNSLKILSRVPHHCALVAIAAPCNCRLILFEEDYLQCIQWSENWKSQIFFKRMNPHTNSDMQGHRFSMQIFSGPVLPTLRFFVWLWMSSCGRPKNLSALMSLAKWRHRRWWQWHELCLERSFGYLGNPFSIHHP